MNMRKWRPLIGVGIVGLLSALGFMAVGQTGPPVILTINVEGEGEVTLSPAPIAEWENMYYYNPDTKVTLTAVAGSGWQFDRWEGDATGTNPTVQVTMDADKTVTAWFTEAVTHTITATAGTGGSISPAGDVTVPHGGSQTFTITPDEGYQIADVVVDGASVGPVESYTFTNVVANHTIHAAFAQIEVTYTITATAGTGGSISPAGDVTVPHGGSQTFTITPDEGYQIADVVVDGASVGAVESYTFTNVVANHTIHAAFAQIGPTYTLTVQVVGQGTTVPPAGSHSYPEGQVVNLSATPAMGWQFSHWQGDATGTNPTVQLTMDADKRVTAVFEEAPPGECWEDNVEAGAGSWSATGLWHITTEKSHSPTHHSWWFGDEETGTYGPGGYTPQATAPMQRGPLSPMATGRVQGTLTSGSIPVAGGTTVEFGFWHFRHVEYYPQGSYDRTWVEVCFDGGDWRTVWFQDSRDPSQEAWEEVVITLTVPEGASALGVRFAFDSVDGLYNNYPGWFIDDIRVCLLMGVRITTKCEDLSNGQVGEAYGPIQLQATGGVRPYTWSATGLPAGLSCSTTGSVAGTPTEDGEFPVTFTVTDSTGDKDTLTCIIVIAPAPPPSGFFEDFEDPTGWTMTGLWHIRGAHQCFTCEKITPKFAYYARQGECDYDTGARTTGTLTSPPIDISGYEAVKMSFDFFRSVEQFNKGAYDQTYLEVRLGEGDWQTIWYRDTRDASPECDSFEKTFATGEAGTLRLRFVFDSVDRYFNKFPGFAVDNVVVAPAASGEPLSAMALPQATPRDQISVGNFPNPVRDVHTTKFQVRGVEADGIRVEVYDLSGRLVWQGEAPGGELEWHTEDQSGLPLANGVYLYKAYVRVGGEWIVTSVQKLVILR